MVNIKDSSPKFSWIHLTTAFLSSSVTPNLITSRNAWGPGAARTTHSARCVDDGDGSDPCQHYTILNDDWRATNNNANVYGEHCDKDVNWQGWYRLFLGNTSVQMPERCVDSYMCGTHAPMWLTDPHPQLLDGVVQRGVCGSWYGDCCSFRQNPIHVKACYGNYYVYKFVPAITCNLAYCADVNTKVCSTCRDDDTCMSEDKITWRCERKEQSSTTTPEPTTTSTKTTPVPETTNTTPVPGTITTTPVPGTITTTPVPGTITTTPVPGTITTTPVPGTITTTPVPGTITTTPVPGTTTATPVPGTITITPVPGTTIITPVPGTITTTPVPGTMTTTPVPVTMTTTPVPGTTIITPVPGTITTTPVPGTMTTTPVPVTMTTTPVPGTITTTPVPGTTIITPVPGTTTTTPVPGITTTTPVPKTPNLVPGTTTTTPVPGSPARTPVPETTTTTPVPETTNTTPVPGTITTTPVPGTITITPLRGTITTTPVPGTITTTPVPGTITITPVPGTITTTPVPGTMTTTPVPGTITTTPVPGTITTTPVPGTITITPVPGTITTTPVPGTMTTTPVPGTITTTPVPGSSTTTPVPSWNHHHNSCTGNHHHNSITWNHHHNSCTWNHHHNSSTWNNHHNSSTWNHHHNSCTWNHDHNSCTWNHHHNSCTWILHHNSSTWNHHHNSCTWNHDHNSCTWILHHNSCTWNHHRNSCTWNHHRNSCTWSHHHNSCTWNHHHNSCTWNHHRNSCTWNHHHNSCTWNHHHNSSTWIPHHNSCTWNHHRNSSTWNHHHNSCTWNHHSNSCTWNHHRNTCTWKHHHNSCTWNHHPNSCTWNPKSSTWNHHHNSIPGTITTTPVPGSPTTTPVPGTITTTPVPGTITTTPLPGTITTTPVPGTITTTPVPGSTTAVPGTPITTPVPGTPSTTPVPETTTTITGPIPGTTIKEPTRPPITAPDLVCGWSLVQVGLNRAHLEAAGLSASSAHLADRRCSAHQEANGTVWYQVARREGRCGNTLETESSLDVALRPYLLPGNGLVRVGAKARASMSLYLNSNYTEPYPAGRVTLPVGSTLHVGVSVEESEAERYVVVLDNCYATESPSPDDLPRFYMIHHRCPSNRTQVRVEESGSSLRARFSALLFLYQGNYRDVFLHCSLSLCDQRRSSCSPSCVCSEEKLNRMMSSGILMTLLFFKHVTADSSGSVVTSCEACHGQATCLDSPVERERGDAFQTWSVTCTCQDGFVGDGITCYDLEFCAKGSCCRQGYRWSSELGCVDVDECSLPDQPCSPPQVCENTPGSFNCLVPPEDDLRSSPGSDSRSVQFQCGGRWCPVGEDCISVGGSSLCADPCQHYSVLNDDWRSTTNNGAANGYHCDTSVNWQGWYRLFLGNTSVQMPERCVESYMCGTEIPLWLPLAHPQLGDGVVQRSVCGHYYYDCCYWRQNPIHVKACYGNYYVYKFVATTRCNMAYCADVNTMVCSTCGVFDACVSDNETNWRCERKAPELVCGRSLLKVGLPNVYLEAAGLDASSAHLADHRCSAHEDRNGTVWYQVERREGRCGNTLETNTTHAVYSNSLFVYPVDGRNDSRPFSFPFSCVYPLETESSLDMAIRPLPLSDHKVVRVGAKAKAYMSLYRDSNYTQPYPAGQPVTLIAGSFLHVGVSVEESEAERFVVVLEDCYANQSPSPDNLPRTYMIQDRCPTNRTQVTVEESGSSLRARFSALLQGDYRYIFLHCSLGLCDQGSSSCTPVCSRRRSRSVSKSIRLKPLTIGPIIYPCQHYTVLNDDWRATNNNANVYGEHCDKDVNWQGWYRLFLGNTSVQMPERCVEMDMCGTHAPMWLTEPHPQLLDGVVLRGVCGSWSGNCCLFQQTPIHVKACYGNYYVYKFVPAITCNLAYCADVNTKVCSTCRDDDTCMSEDKITWRCERKAHTPTTPRITVTTTNPPIMAPEVVCGQSIIQVGLNRANLKAAGLNASTAHLADTMCSAHEDRNGTVWYQVERREGRCGNTLETNTTHAVYSNSLFVYPVDGRNDSLSRPVSYPFSCVYPLETESSLDVALRPYLLNSRGAVGVGAKARASMFLYRNSNYTESYPAGEVLLPIGSTLCVGVSVEESGMERFVVVLRDCYANQSPSPDNLPRTYMIQDRCPTNRTQVTVEESGSSLRARFSALLQGDYRYIFLHCSLSLCDQGSSSCTPVCSGRNSRSVSESVLLKPIAIGPISWAQSLE
eukprot:XP_013985877.1 PREDICTED: uncharacterized protein LOC106564346 [Salmo salar]